MSSSEVWLFDGLSRLPFIQETFSFYTNLQLFGFLIVAYARVRGLDEPVPKKSYPEQINKLLLEVWNGEHMCVGKYCPKPRALASVARCASR